MTDENETNETEQSPAPTQQEILVNELAATLLKVLKVAPDVNGTANEDVDAVIAEVMERIPEDDNFITTCNEVMQDVVANLDTSEISQDVIDNIDPDEWGVLTTENFDIDDYNWEIESIAESVVDNHEFDTDVESQVTEWIQSGCDTVSDYAYTLLQRALTRLNDEGEPEGTVWDHNQDAEFVILTRHQHTRIMNAVTRLEEIGIVSTTEVPTPEEAVNEALGRTDNPIALANYAMTQASAVVTAYQVRLNTMKKQELLEEAGRLNIPIDDANKVTKAQLLELINLDIDYITNRS